MQVVYDFKHEPCSAEGSVADDEVQCLKAALIRREVFNQPRLGFGSIFSFYFFFLKLYCELLITLCGLINICATGL